MHIESAALIVRDYDVAIKFFVEALGFEHGVVFDMEPRDEPCGRIAVFLDGEGNQWDLLGPPTP